MINNLTFDVDVNVINHLGIGLYSSIPAAIAELVANCWDADAYDRDPRFSDHRLRHGQCGTDWETPGCWFRSRTSERIGVPSLSISVMLDDHSVFAPIVASPCDL